ncbi:hypothetical protein B0H17DRAFT_1216505 [Mycena rosella]|uniref:MPN domain-containing protein n=1 Tax=Mycena rosella TaxID=1033263 RepID=A0AAD7FSC9_MYCRO|nr:hypothetical protein B0H17DRAFT_1216505 [Mycena rosella]
MSRCTASTASSAPPVPITIHPVALFSILDHYLRRNDDQPRVIGTLLGTRSPDNTSIHVRSSFAVLHSENGEQVAVDMEYHRTMYELHSRVNRRRPSYSTGLNLNTCSALIQNFYSQETAPHQAIHVALSTGAERLPQIPRTAYSSPSPVRLQFQDAERSGLDLLTQTALSPNSTTAQPVTNITHLDTTLSTVAQMLDSVLAYVRQVLAGEAEGDKALGRYLMDTLGVGPISEKGGEDKAFNTSLQDTLMISYLANLVRSQAEVSSRLALVTS